MADWKAWRMRRQCTDKKLRFVHPGQARREADRRGLRAYKCSLCDHWHLTSLALRTHRALP